MYCPLLSAGALRDCDYECMGKSYFFTVHFFSSIICLPSSQPALTLFLPVTFRHQCLMSGCDYLLHGLRKTLSLQLNANCTTSQGNSRFYG